MNFKPSLQSLRFDLINELNQIMNDETQNKTSVETFKMNQSRIGTSVTPKNQSDAELASPTTLINEVASDGSKNTREWTAEKRSIIGLKDI